MVPLNRARLATHAAKQLAAMPIAIAPHRPVFIIGCARSGTSVLKRLLGAHPEIDAYPSEANELWHPRSYPWHSGARRTPPLWQAPAAFTADSLSQWPARHSERLRRVFGWHQRLTRRPVFLGKSSMINFMLVDVDRLFPDARFIHIVRDGRAVALSYAEKEHRKMLAAPEVYRDAGAWYDFDSLIRHMGRLWQATLAEINRQCTSLGWSAAERYHRCHYEDLCADPSAVLTELLGFIGADQRALPLGEPVRDMNHKFRERLSPVLLRDLDDALGDILAAQGYRTASA